MSERVTMPALGESVTEGTVTRWLKNVGDTVAVDEPLLEVSTDKVDTEIPSPVAGTVLSILVGEDETVVVGAELAVIGDAAEVASGSAEPAPAQADADDAAPAQAEPAAAAPPDDPRPAPVPAEAAPEPAPVPDSPSTEAAAPAGSDGEIAGGERVTMPALGESVTEGTITRWLKAEGDQVAVDEPLLEVSTDKVDTEIPSPVAGTLTKILVAEDQTVPVGAELAIIGGSAAPAPQVQAPEPAAPPPPPQAAPPAAPQVAAPQVAAPQVAAPQVAAPQVAAPQVAAPQVAAPQAQPAAPAEGDAADASAYVTPLVRKLAADHGVDLGSLQGTGVGGRIRKQDVLDAAKAAAAPPAEPATPVTTPPATIAGHPPVPAGVSPKRGTVEKMSRMRRIIAQRMVESLQVSAQLTTVVEVDVTRVATLRAKAKSTFAAREGVKLSFLPFFALAAVEALKAFPMVNASVDGESIVYHGQENLGVAVDTERGLMVPVIRDAGDLNLAGLARKISDLAERTRTNKITPDDLGGGTFTLTNTGSRGALFDTPIINQPQVAILGTGAVVKRPMVVKDTDGGETIAIRSMAYLALSYDHRIVDGADAARFLTAMKGRLEEGSFEV
ncbi:MAG TPA: 2-oxoglutarate dehydrogenase, E2 component, dihydrolipoamide succinyltransferase [Dermatophilaceae bacterium]|nr:2-oxoglutarate dehydrogenase, E2 component, dihydrolipoamide succinyltransferase [Dermatophilaceae bacterium]